MRKKDSIEYKKRMDEVNATLKRYGIEPISNNQYETPALKAAMRVLKKAENSAAASEALMAVGRGSEIIALLKEES